jgi:hypothetical protein
MDRLQTFPASDSIAAMRETGIRYVVVRAVADPLEKEHGRSDTAVRLVDRVDRDYFYEVLPGR